MRSKINLAVITPGFPRDEKDSATLPGLQLYLAGLMKYHPEISILVISLHYPKSRGESDWKGIRIIREGGSCTRAGKIILWARALRHLWQILKKDGIDVVHCFWLTDTALVGSVFGFLSGKPVLLTAMGRDIMKANRYLEILKFFKPWVTFLSEFQRDYNPELSKKRKSQVIPIGIDPGYFARGEAPRTVDIIGVGSLNPGKDYPAFIRVVGEVVRTMPGIRCSIIGEGPGRGEIEDLIARHHLENTIETAGEFSYENTIRAMETTRILLHTSSFEGQGLIITEALAAGACVVCHPTGIAAQIRSKKLFTGITEDDLISHIISILTNPFPDYSPEIVITLEDTCKDFTDIYHNLVSGKWN